MRLPWQRSEQAPEPIVDTRPLAVRAAEAAARHLAEDRQRESDAIAKARHSCAQSIRLVLGITVDTGGWTTITRPRNMIDEDVWGPIVTLRGAVEGVAIEGEWKEAFNWEFGAPATSDYCQLYVGHGTGRREIHSLADIADHAAT
jgi:hypothetical protein